MAGTLVAFGAVGLAMAVAGAVGSQLGLRTDGISTDEWRDAGLAGAVGAAIVLFGSFLLGGYTAGRMSRRAGARHGLFVFVLAVVVGAVVAGLTAWLGDTTSLRDELSSEGVPVDANTWSDIGIGAGIAGVVAMLLGSIVGGIRGDRWHGRLVTAAIERRNEEIDARRHERWRRDEDEGGDRRRAVDLRDRDRGDGDRTETELSVEEERERVRTGRSDVGL